MKWYSIKKFTPPTSQDLILRIVKNPDSYTYERYIIASCELLYDDMSNVSWWELSNGCQIDIELHDYYVTHFAIIDPIEIE